MNQHNIFAKKKMHLDNNVWLVMLVTIFLCLGLLGYRKMEDNSCNPFTISSRGLLSNQNGTYEVGETVIFSTSSPVEKEITWQFGDHTYNQKAVSATMRHKFVKQGVYTVRAIINEKCSKEITVNIKRSDIPVVLPENTNVHAPTIYGDSTPKIGKPQRYLSDAIGNSYEWKILNKSLFPAINEQAASYTFTKPGLYILQLTVDHDRKKRSVMQINVSEDLAKEKNKKNEKPTVLIPFDIRPKEKEKPEKQEDKQPDNQPKLPEKPTETVNEAAAKKVVFIHNQIFKSLLEGVVTGQKDVADFDQFLIYGGATKVRVNNKKSYKTFSKLCQEIRGKKVTIQSVDLKREENDKTKVMQIEVNYKKKSLVDRVFSK